MALPAPLEFCAAIVRRFREERALQTAGSLTFTTLLSLAPLLAVILAIASAFPAFESGIAALRVFVLKNALPETPGVQGLVEQLNSFSRNAGRLTAIGLAAFAVTAIMLMRTIDNTINRVFRVQRLRTVLQNVLMYWALLTLWPLLIGASLSITSYAVGASLGFLHPDGPLSLLFRLLPFVLTCAALILLYGIVPARRVDWKHAVIGGIVAGVAFELAKRGFALYLARVPTFRLVYGAFATIPVFLLWLYLSWVVVICGAIFTALLPGWRARSDYDRAPGEQLADAAGALAILARAHAEGRLMKLNAIAAELRVLPYRVEQVLEQAARLRWTARVGTDRWVLSRDPEAIPLDLIYRTFVYDPKAVGISEDDLGLSLRDYAEKRKRQHRHP
jgi:membrane protein